MQDLTELTAWPYRNDLLISGSDLKISQITDLSPPKYSPDQIWEKSLQ